MGCSIRGVFSEVSEQPEPILHSNSIYAEQVCGHGNTVRWDTNGAFWGFPSFSLLLQKE